MQSQKLKIIIVVINYQCGLVSYRKFTHLAIHPIYRCAIIISSRKILNFMTVNGHCQLNFTNAFNTTCDFFSPYNIKGKVRVQRLERPAVIKISAPLTTVTPKHKADKTPAPLMPSMTTG